MHRRCITRYTHSTPCPLGRPISVTLAKVLPHRTALISALRVAFGVTGTEGEAFTPDWYAHTYQRLARNAYYVQRRVLVKENEGEEKESEIVLGVVCYVRLCLVNHSCRPNCAIQRFDGRHHLVALRPLLQGEQVYISYSNTVREVNERLCELASRHRFLCRCELCREQAHLVTLSTRVRVHLLLGDLCEMLEPQQLLAAVLLCSEGKAHKIPDPLIRTLGRLVFEQHHADQKAAARVSPSARCQRKRLKLKLKRQQQQEQERQS